MNNPLDDRVNSLLTALASVQYQVTHVTQYHEYSEADPITQGNLNDACNTLVDLHDQLQEWQEEESDPPARDPY